MAWTYGAAFYVYEDGALSWLGIQGAFWNDMTWHGWHGWIPLRFFFLGGEHFFGQKMPFVCFFFFVEFSLQFWIII